MEDTAFTISHYLSPNLRRIKGGILMSQNDLILLEQLLNQRLAEIGEELSLPDYFEIFSAEHILKDEELSYEEIINGIVDDGGDGGIDSFYFFLNGTLFNEDLELASLRRNVQLKLVMIQSKSSAGFTETGIDKFISSARDLFDLNRSMEELGGVYNMALLKKVAQFRKTYLTLTSKFPDLTFRYAYVAKAIHVHPNVKRKIVSLQDTITHLFSPVHFYFDFVNASQLLALARKSPSRSYELPLAENPISTGQEAYVCLVALPDFHAFITDEEGRFRGHLFEGNVRDYQGRTEVNQEIRKTLEHPGSEDFWWLNNGVSILCSRSSLSGKVLTIEDPEIVNGLQTSREIYETMPNMERTREKRNVLVRILKPKDDGSRDNIIKATNSQTQIPPASLRATDKIHRDIEDYLSPRGLFYDRRKNYYKNIGKPIKHIIGIPFMAQAVMSCALQDPANARARPSSLIKDDAAYDRIFNPSYPLDVYYKCAEVARKVDSFLRTSEDKFYRDHRTNLRFYVAMLVTLRLTELPKPSIPQVAEIDLSKLNGDVLSEAASDVRFEYERLGATDQVAKGAILHKTLRSQHQSITQQRLRAQSSTRRQLSDI